VHRPKMRSFLSKKNYIRVVVCCLARLNVPGTEAKHNRTFLLLPVYRHYTQHFSVFILIALLILTMKLWKKKEKKLFVGSSWPRSSLQLHHMKKELNELGLKLISLTQTE
jgi:hypothetical protein